VPRTAGRCRSGRLGPVREVEPGEVGGGPRPAMGAHGRSHAALPGPGRSRAGQCVHALRRSAGSRGLRRVVLGLSQLGHGDGKLCEHCDEHQHRGLVPLAQRRREREQPGGGPQLVPGWCGRGNPPVAAASRASVAVCRLSERPAAQDLGGDMQGVRGRPGGVGSRRRIGEGARPDRVGGPRGSITCAVPDVTAFLGAQPDIRDARAELMSAP
jgi:hypothetical protein